ncbi:MAG: class I SAM-dependent methyltransferase [Betaproteobacteria bacterium]|nr:class I SAM-dependent methyltransferase [Betaproteobacteria bacterium]
MRPDFPRLPSWLLALCFTSITGTGYAQERFSIFVASNLENVGRMVALAKLKAGETVVDLGSGDGRVVISAARAHPGVRGWGVDVDEKLVRESNEEAQKEGVANRVKFFHRNAFDADLSKVDVIFMWLWPEVQRMLRTKILAEARPGARIVTNLWDVGTWPADEVDDNGPNISLWVVPARAAGNWRWDLPIRGGKTATSAVLEQHFQAVEGVVRSGTRRGVIADVKLRGDAISFVLTMTLDKYGYSRQVYAGRILG